MYALQYKSVHVRVRVRALFTTLFHVFTSVNHGFFSNLGLLRIHKGALRHHPPPPLAARLPPSSSSARAQVSRLPAGLTDRWDKERRFAAAWSLVRELRPSSFLTTSSTPLDGAQGAYESLGAGSELGVVFRY